MGNNHSHYNDGEALVMTAPRTDFECLPVSRLESGSTCAQAYSHRKNIVSMQSSALEVMTDLHFVPASTITSGETVEIARRQMISQGVRLLFVVDPDQEVIGLITARDFNVNADVGQVVDKAMTPFHEIEVVEIDDILHAVVGDLVETLKKSQRQHALAAEQDFLTEKAVIRGIFSATQIARQLGISVDPEELTHTFEELDRKMGADASTDQAV